MNYLKVFFLTSVFAFSIHAASAQKSSKTAEKSPTQQRIEQSRMLTSQTPASKWVYSTVLVTDLGGRFDVKFDEQRSKAGERMAEQNRERMKKMEVEIERLTSEADVMNMLAELEMELISVVAVPESQGRTMKYYLRTQLGE